MKYIALLRGINLGNHNKMPMKALQELCTSLGFKNVQTYIQSGNAVFEYENTDAIKLTEMIEKKMRQSFGFEVPVLIRTANEFQTILKNLRTFAGKGENESVYVTFLAEKPADIPADEIKKVQGSNEQFSVSGKEIYLLCPDGYGRTKLSNTFFERKLKTSATTRNGKTVSALASL